jgi:hypothetical protein
VGRSPPALLAALILLPPACGSAGRESPSAATDPPAASTARDAGSASPLAPSASGAPAPVSAPDAAAAAADAGPRGGAAAADAPSANAGGGDGAAAPVVSYPASAPGGPYRVDDMGPSDPCKDVSIPEGQITIEGWTPYLWLPGGVRPIRCLIGGAAYLHELARMHHCGVIRQPPPSPAALLATLKAFAELTGHPELEHVQVIGSGYSAAFGRITGIAARMPDRFLAIFGGGIHQAYPKGGMLAVPWLGFGGSRDGPSEVTNNMIFTGHLAESGPQGALYGFTMRWGRQHEQGDSRHLMLPFYHQIIARRAPRPGTAINGLVVTTLKREDGWLMSPDDWHTPYPTIAPYADYKGDKGKASWLPDSYMAHVARAYGAGSGPAQLGRTMGPPLELTQPPCAGEACTPRSAGVRSRVLYEVAFTGEAPRTIELWDGDRPLFAVAGPPYRVEIVDWQPGVHAIYALGTYADGRKAVSKPRTVVVNRPGMTAASCPRDGGAARD